MTCCPSQDMGNTYQSSLQLSCGYLHQSKSTRPASTSPGRTNWTRWVTKHSRGKEDAGARGKGEQRMEQGAQDQDDAYMYETVKE